MIMCIQNLVLIGLFVFKILSKNLILTSIKGRNYVANLPKFELIQAFMHVLDICKNEEDPIKNEGARVFTRFLPLKVYGDFSSRSRAANSAVLGPIWPKFELVRDVMDVLVTCKYEEDPIKSEGARMVTTFYSNFSVAQGQITVQAAKRLYPSRLRTWNFASQVTFLRGFCEEVVWVLRGISVSFEKKISSSVESKRETAQL